MSRVMRKLDFCICKNKDADQPRGNPKLISAFGLLHRKYNPSTTYIRNFKSLAILCGCTAWFVSDLVGNPEDPFSHNKAHM